MLRHEDTREGYIMSQAQWTPRGTSCLRSTGMRTLGKDTSSLRHGGTQEGYIVSQA